MIQIEKNIPMPAAKRGKTCCKYPFADMVVGDSISLEIQDAKRAYSAACCFARGKGIKFSMRKLEDKVRIWRIT